MLTKDEIRKRLKEDPDWEPRDTATDREWDLYDEVRDEMFEDEDEDFDDDDDMDY